MKKKKRFWDPKQDDMDENGAKKDLCTKLSRKKSSERSCTKNFGKMMVQIRRPWNLRWCEHQSLWLLSIYKKVMK